MDKIITDGYSKIKDFLNESHSKYGYTKHRIATLISGEYGFPLDVRFNMGYFSSESSIMEVNGHLFSVDDLITFFVSKDIIKQKRISIPIMGSNNGSQMARRYFTTDYEGYQKNKKRREVIDKVLNSQ